MKHNNIPRESGETFKERNSAKLQTAAPSQALIAYRVSSVRLITERASASTAQVVHEMRDLRCDAYTHSGLNE